MRESKLKHGLSLLLSLGYVACSQSIFLNSAIAQVSSDGTTSTIVDVDGNDFTIEQGDRAGNNLFHSFHNFSIPTNGSAFFNNSADIVNIFSRVTGGNISNIDGLLGANGTASLYLINPAGIIFGPGARLNIGGSFFGSTADSLIFPDGEFSATNLANPPLLTINAPIGLNFRDNPEDIINRSVANDVGLQVTLGKNITLVGGNINLDAGKLTAPGGIINLGGLSTTGEIGINSDGSLSFPDDIARANVTLTNQAEVKVRSSNGGAININANQFELREESLLAAGIEAASGFQDAQAGNITIDANNIIASGNSEIRNENLGIGNAGNINITTDRLEFSEGSAIVASTFGQGNAGDVNITATGDIRFDRDFGGVFSTVGVKKDERESNVSGVVGNGGDINIAANSFFLTNGGSLSTKIAGIGNGGNINLNISQTTSIEGKGEIPINSSSPIATAILAQIESGNDDGTRISGQGNGGNVTINTSDFILRSVEGQVFGPFILADNKGGIGDTGNITISATGSISLSRLSQLSTIISPNSIGNAGSIQLNTTNLLVNRAFVQTFSQGQGNAGDINITTESFSLTENARINSSVIEGAQGNAGDINITASGDIFIGNNSQFASQILRNAQGDSGNINIEAKSLTIQGSRIGVDNQGTGNSGNITINATESVTLDSSDQSSTGRESLIISQLQRNVEGEGGDINITAPLISLNNFALISTNTKEGSIGNARNITLNADRISVNNGSVVDALTETDSNGGDITINADLLELRNGGKIVTGNDQSGNAGTIKLNITGDVILNNANPPGNSPFDEQILQDTKSETGIFANNFPGSTGDGGIIEIEADSIKFEDQGSISAETVSGRGGNIELIVNELISLRNNSVISARAVVSGDGGNVDIDTKFIVAFPNQNSDILTSANQGRGGDINITAEALFGIQERPLDGRTNDINASSEVGLDGTISIFTPDINSIQTDTAIPNSIIESEQIVGQACQRDRVSASGADRATREASGLIVTGKGGIPRQPIDFFNSETLFVGKTIATRNFQAQYPDIKPIKTNIGDIYPAKGIVKKKDGKIILTAYATDNLNSRKPHISANCGIN